MTDEAVKIGLGSFETALGLVSLILGLKGNAYRGGTVAARLRSRSFAPMGMLWMLAGTFHLLSGHVPDATLITLEVLGLAATAIWAVQTRRTLKAHVQGLKKAGPSES